MDESLDGVFDEIWFGFVFEGGLDLVDKCLASGRSVVGGASEFGLD